MKILNKTSKRRSVLASNTQGALRFLMILFFFVLVFPVKSAIAVNWAYTESEAIQTTTSEVFQDAATLNFTANNGDYIVIAAFELGGATNSPSEARLLIEGVEEGLVSQQYISLSYQCYYSMGWIKKVTFTEGSKTIKVQYRGIYDPFYSAYIRNIHIFTLKAEGLQYTETETQQNLTTTETTLATLTFTPSATQDYLILASVEGRPASTSSSITLRLKVDGAEKNKIDSEGSATTDYRGHGIVLLQNLDTTFTHTIQITGQAESGTMYARNIRIAAIPIGGLTHYSSAPLAIDAKSSGTGTGSTITVSHTTGTGTNRLMLVGISGYRVEADPTISSVTYGGVALTLVGTQASPFTGERMWIYRLVAPASGTANVVVTFGAAMGGGAGVGVITFTGVDQTTPLGTFVSANGESATATVNVSSATGELVFDTLHYGGPNSSTPTVGAGQTQRWNLVNNPGPFGYSQTGGSTEPGAATVTMSWTFESNTWALGAVPIKPASQAETETSTTFMSTSYEDKLSYSPTISNAGDHIIFATSEAKIAGVTTQKFNNLLIDSSQYHELIEYPKDDTDYVSTFFLKKRTLSAGSHTFKIQHKTTSLSNPAYTKNARIVVLQLPQPTAVKLQWVQAHMSEDRVRVEWKTGYEVDNLGFHVYREENGQLYRLTPEIVAGSALLAGAGTALTAGHHYHWWDFPSLSTQSAELSPQSSSLGTLKYWLEDIDLSGRRTRHGPVTPVLSQEPLPKKFRPDLLSEVGLKLQEKYRDYWRIQELKEKLKNRGPSRLGRDSRSARPVEYSPFIPQGKLEAKQNRRLASSPAGTLLKARRAGPRGNSVPDPQTQQFLAGMPAVKLFVKEEGWYRVSQPELLAAGLSSRVNPRYLQLFVDGKEQPIRVVGEKDERFDPGDAIEFYGVGLDTPSTDTRVYWLISGVRSGERIDEYKGRGGQISSSNFPYTVERKDRTIYFAALKNGDEENFFGPVVCESRVDQLLEVRHLDLASSGDALLEVVLQGATDGPHRVKVFLNDEEVGEVIFEGQSRGLLQLEVPQAFLDEGENLVSLETQNGEMDVSVLDYIRLTYWRTYTADEDTLKFTAQSGEQVSIDGFSHPRIRVLDITDPNAIFEVMGTVNAKGSGYVVTFRVPGYEQRTMLALTEEKVKNPEGIVANQPSSWHQSGSVYDLVIITHRDFFNNLQPLKSLRESQGLKVALIDAEDLYDEFSFGSKSPQAIKDFLALAKANWRRPPRFVLLVGDASFDPRNYLGAGNFDFVPTKLIDTVYFQTASDDWFVDLNGDGLPEMAVGRLPVRTVEEANTVVSKIIGYERSRRVNEALLVADINDGFDFEGATEEVRGLLPASIRVRKIFRGSLSSDEQVKQEILRSINEGLLLVNFMGHGSVEIWRGNILTSDDAEALVNKGLPFFVSMTCLNGFFQDLYTESLAEALLKSPQGGAVAVWASSGLTEPNKQAVMNKELIGLLFSSDSITLGEATSIAKAATGDQDIRKTWILFGDPTTRLK